MRLLQRLRKAMLSYTKSNLRHVKSNIYRMYDHNGRGYYWHVHTPSGYTYYQTLADAEKEENRCV